MLVWICMFSLERHFPFYFKTHILWTYHTVKGCTGQVFTLVMFLKWKTENNSNGHQENARYTVDIIQPTKKKVTAPYVSICPVYTFLTLKKAHKAVCTLCYHFVLFFIFLVGGDSLFPYLYRQIHICRNILHLCMDTQESGKTGRLQVQKWTAVDRRDFLFL